jgi:cholesterol oxidase
MNRLSSPLPSMKPHYEVIVIGSGYGGSIAASRMARAGFKVCLLEKGKEFRAGDFPSDLKEAVKEMQLTRDHKQLGSENGLYEFVVGKDINVFKGCGLGGTSLVNANVSIEIEDRVFEDSCWPSAMRQDMESFRQGVRRAKEMLKPVQYPEGKKGYPELAKTKGMKQSAKHMGEEFRLLNINVNFEDQINHVGVEQKKCINCGDCVSGCNHMAKNTTDLNYLPDAKNHGAEIYTNVGVQYIERQGDHWLIHFEVHGSGRDKFDAPPLFVRADKVFICAGSLGSTEILLRSSRKGLDVSPMLGHNFTGNGDVLGFAYNCDQEIHGIGLGDKAKEGKIDQVGPCITSVIDMRHQQKLDDGMVIEEGSVPGPISSMMSSLVPFSRLLGKDSDEGMKDWLTEKAREVESMARGAYHGAIDNTQVYLVMTHDDSKGEIRLQDDHLLVHWPGVGKQKIFEQVHSEMEKATEALGGTFVRNPTWTKLLNYDLVTVHPLGGCKMGEDAKEAVVDHTGQVFKGRSGTEVYPGLYVMDGAIIPRSLGANPLLTISGLAERNCKIIAERAGKTLKYDFPAIPPAVESPHKVGFQFTETMTGFISTERKADFQMGFEDGKKNRNELTFTLTILGEDTDRFVEDQNHEAQMFGSVIAPALSPDPLTVSNGRFNLFVKDPNDPGLKKMKYEMLLYSQEGKTYFFKGFKEIRDDKGFDMWQDTTTLFIDVYEGENESGSLFAKGILEIKPKDFARQMTTMKAVNAKNLKESTAALAKFGKLFSGSLWETYVKPKIG